MSVQALGYMGVRAKSVENWADYGTRQLGLQRIDKSASTLAFRMDDRKQRIIVNQDSGDGIGFFGWEVADAPRARTPLRAVLTAARRQGCYGSPRARGRAARQRTSSYFRIRSAIGSRPSTAQRAPPIHFCPGVRSRASVPACLAWATSSSALRTPTRCTRCFHSIRICSASVSPITTLSRSRRDFCTSTRGITASPLSLPGRTNSII